MYLRTPVTFPWNPPGAQTRRTDLHLWRRRLGTPLPGPRLWHKDPPPIQREAATVSYTQLAELMRPRAPKPGKRVILEYIRPLWRRMNFNMKVTARNLFRYQKRFWMTVIGIGGCTALIIAGFGLRSSLLVTMDRQYDELYHYTAQLSLCLLYTSAMYQD